MNTHKGPENLDYVKKNNNLLLRSISGIVLVLIFFSSILYQLPSFTIIITIIGILMFYEWYNMVKYSTFYAILGILVITPSILSLITLDTSGYHWLIFSFFILIWSMDSFAMLIGKTIKGPKLAPTISPNKTWSGLIGGAIASTICTMVFMKFIASKYSPFISLLFKINIFLGIIIFILCIIAQVSDLFISYFKRKFGIKDTGHIIPGHGGFLDRFDSIIITSPLLLLMVYLI
jgi:phosphatidate cytidylyltransferase